MFLWLKRLSGSMADGRWFSANPDVVPLDLARDGEALDALIAADGAAISRQDLASLAAQPGAVALVARLDGALAGVFVGRPVGTAAHVDFVAVTPARRKGSVARPLWFTGVNKLTAAGARGLVVHARPPTTALLDLLGFTAGARFVELSQEVGEVTVSGGHRGELVDGSELTVDEVATLDREVFGADRIDGLRQLFDRNDVDFHGFRKKGALIAALALQRGPDGSLKVRLAEGKEFRDISSLLHVVLVMNSGKRIRVLAREGGKLASMLESLEFDTSDAEPWVEYRFGETAGVGDGEGVLHLSWW